MLHCQTTKISNCASVVTASVFFGIRAIKLFSLIVASKQASMSIGFSVRPANACKSIHFDTVKFSIYVIKNLKGYHVFFCFIERK